MKFIYRWTLIFLTGLFLLMLFRIRELAITVERLTTSVSETVTLADVTKLLAHEKLNTNITSQKEMQKSS